MLRVKRSSEQPSVVIVTMAFPAASEAFAGVEVRALLRSGARVVVHALRPLHRVTMDHIGDWGLDGLSVTHLSAGTPGRGLMFVLHHPRMAAATFLWLLRYSWRHPWQLVRGIALLPRCFEIFRQCLLDPPDVLHLFWGHFPAAVGYMANRWLHDTHVSTSLGAYDLLMGYGPGIDVARRSDSVWTQAEYNRAALLAMGIPPGRSHVLVRGVDREQLSEIGQRSRTRGARQVVAVARLERNKGVDDVLRAFAAAAAAAADDAGARLVVIGEGPELAALRRLSVDLGIERKVEFQGALPHSEVIRTLLESGVFMLLSRNPSERLPNALKEAMACGCVCIVTQTPGIEEITAVWSKPCIVQQGDWAAAARLLREVFARPDDWESDRRAAQRYILERLDADAVARARLQVWTGAKARKCVA